MDTADDLLLDLIESIALDVLARIGDDPDARRFSQQSVRQRGAE
jgi:hypothetical protein